MSVPVQRDDAKTTVVTLQQKKDRGERIAMLTAYDYPAARILDAAGIDALLVGDSLAMVVLGHDDTLAVTMDEMLHHARAVARGARRSLLIADMPFLSYQADTAEAVRNAGRFLKEAGMDAVKLEGGRDYADTVRAIVRAGIPVMGHAGLLPQSVHQLGGYRTQARTAEDATALLADALALEAAGCFALVLESVPAKVAAVVTDRLRIPTIGIGAGNGTSGQVLVLHDLLGLQEQTPRFVRRYAGLSEEIARAVRAYRDEVGSAAFPGPEESFTIADAEWAAFLAAIGARTPQRTAR
jgi:3-methyl-2-oxobutanoate hydroxymethyltransferase